MKTKNRLKRIFSSGLLVDLISDTERTHTRKINPKMGLMGFCGFLGFLGLIEFSPEFITVPFPFFFFAFFGFFGFYYEGKMSNTLIDERFKVNAYRAEAIANKVSLIIIILVTILFTVRIEDVKTLLGILISTIGVAFGISIFLQQYLLYKFENEA